MIQLPLLVRYRQQGRGGPDYLLQFVVPRTITEYLLNPAHPDNGGKAAFFLSSGFSREDWQALAAAFRAMAENLTVAISMASPHGQKYIVEGNIETPSGKVPRVRTVWIVDHGLDIPRLVTAYPQEE